MKKKSKRKLTVSREHRVSDKSSSSPKTRGRPKKPDVVSVLTTMSDTLTGILLELQKLNGARPYWDPINPYVPNTTTTFGPIPPLPQDSEPYKVVVSDNLTPNKSWSVAQELSKMVEELQPEIKDILNRFNKDSK